MVKNIFMWEMTIVQVEAIEKFRLLLKNVFYLDLDEIFIVSSFR